MASKRMEMNEETVEASGVSLNVLNDYCLLHIFEMLSLNCRIGIGRVDRRWKHLCESLWRQQRTLLICYGGSNGNVKIHMNNSLPFDKLYFTCNKFDRKFNLIMCETASHVDNVLKRCEGSTVFKTLRISHVTDERTLFSIGERCLNIEHLTLQGVPASMNGLQFLGNQCKSLREVHLESCDGVTDDALKSLLINNHALQVIELNLLEHISGTFLDYVSSTIQQIHVEYCHFDVQHLKKNMNRFHQLLKLTCDLVDNSTLKCIVENATQLQDLTLYDCYELNSHKLLIQLTNLISLNIIFNHWMNDDALRLISRRCLKLESLSISHCELIRNNAFQNLTFLSNLKILSLCWISINDDLLKLISTICLQLKELDISDCPRITNYGIQNVQNLSNLKKLSLINLSITDDALKFISTTTIGGEGVGCIQLESLDINTCNKITNNGIEHLTNLTNLKVLNISNLLLINDEALFALSSVQTLTKLICNYCSLITDRGVKEIFHKCKKLTYLDVSGCRLITMSTVNEAANVIKTNRTNLPLILVVKRTRVRLQQILDSLPARIHNIITQKLLWESDATLDIVIDDYS